jgi:hypothetical protein
MRHHQIPAVAEHMLDWLLQVPLRIRFALQQVAAPCVVATAAKRVSHAAGILASN